MSQISDQELWVQSLRQRLVKILDNPSAPVLDVEWLIERCDDTLPLSDHWRQASFAQLLRDVEAFDSEFPGYLKGLQFPT